MSVLYPLLALGAVAVGVPIWLHLRRRDERNLVEFSTLRFLDDQPLARARPLWPRHWPLLLLRIAALLLLVTAFTWPYVEGEETVVVQESRVYILDNTLSNQVDDQFTTARDRIANELADNDVRTQMAVLELSTTANTLVRFGDDKLSAAESIRRVQPSAARGNFVDAFRSAAEMLATSMGTRQRIVLLSDGQANQWTLGDDSPPFLSADIEIDLPAPIESDLANLSLSDPQARRLVREGRDWIQAGARLTIQGQPKDAVVVFRDGGREVSRQPITLSGADGQPPSGVVFAEWQSDREQWMIGEIVIEDHDDVLSGDDRLVFSLPPLRPGRVELVTDSLFLKRALDPEVMLGRWEVQLSDPQTLVDRTGPRGADVLCVESHALTSSAVRDAIRDDLSGGRGVMLMVNQASPTVAGFLRDLGIELSASQTSSADPATFRYVFAEHPIFAPFRSAELGNLAEIEFTNYRRLMMRDAMPLAFSVAGDPLVFEVNAGPGRMLVFAFAFQRGDTNWPIHPSFIPFLDKSLDYLRGEMITTTTYQPGESVVWDLPPGKTTNEVLISPLDPATGQRLRNGPDTIRAGVRNRQASFQLPPLTGHYSVTYGTTDPLVSVLDVNPSPQESDLTYEPDPQAITAWTREDSGQASQTTDEPDTLDLTPLEALQQRYWWYVLLAAIAAIVTETLYSTMVRPR